MIVVDTNIISYFWIKGGEYTPLAERVFEKDPAWCAPFLWRSEFCNVLSGYLRRNSIVIQEAMNIVRKVEKFFENHEYSISGAATLELIAKSSCSAYDCEFVALAQRLNVPLVSADQKILNTFPNFAKSMRDFMDWEP